MTIDEQLDAACKEMESHVKTCDVCRNDPDKFCPYGDRKVSEIQEMEVEIFNDAIANEAEENGYGK